MVLEAAHGRGMLAMSAQQRHVSHGIASAAGSENLRKDLRHLEIGGARLGIERGMHLRRALALCVGKLCDA
jgi:hypothetical protein